MSYFPLNYICSIRKKVATEDRSGQQVISEWVESEQAKCLFMHVSGNKQVTAREEFQGVYAMYFDPSCGITEGDRVYDIGDRRGNIIEPGPLEVISVKTTPGPLGKIHHVSAKLKGSSS